MEPPPVFQVGEALSCALPHGPYSGDPRFQGADYLVILGFEVP